MAVTGTGPVLGALTNGANAVSAVTWGSGYATDTGTLAPVVRQIRRGSNPWRAVAATELVTTGQTVRFREVVFNTDYVGEAFTTDEVTVGAAAITAQTAYFGSSTLSGQGGFKPVDAGGVDMDVLSIVSGGATSPAAQVVDGRLSFAGTGAPNGATIRLETAEGEVDVTIATVAGKSIADAQHLAVALQAQVSSGSPIDLMLRPGAYDVNGGPNGSAASIANGIFHNRQIPQARRATVKPHPSQAGEAYFYKAVSSRTSTWFSTSWITFDGVNFRSIANSSQMITGGATTGTNFTNNITFSNVQFIGPEVSSEDLNDPTLWTGVGYSGILLQGPKLDSSYNITLENVTFRNINTAGDYNTEGLQMNNVTGDVIYFDFMRLHPPATTVQATPRLTLIQNVTATGFFAINNEISNTPTNKAPHNDFFQIIGGTLRNAVFRNVYCTRGGYRGDVLTPMQFNSRLDRVLFHECLTTNLGVVWAMTNEGSNYNLFNQCTMVPSALTGASRFRFGVEVTNPDTGVTTARPAVGEHRLRNTYVGGGDANANITSESSDPNDPYVLTLENSFTTINTAITGLLQGPANPATLAAGLTSYAPQVGSTLDTNGIGALTTAGAFRGTEIPPMCGLAPSLGVSGADVIITPSVSLYYDGETAPTVWEWRHRTGDGATWSSWTEETGATATATGLADSGRQFMYRWKNSAGVAGVASDVTAVA